MRSVLCWVLASGCAIAEPFEGPLYSSTDGLLAQQDELVVAVTYIQIDPGSDVRALFDGHVADITDVLDDQPGFVGSALRSAIPGRDRWTMTVWTDEQSLMDFVVGPTHAAAMADVGLITSNAATTHYTVPADQVPVPWDLALAELPEPGAY